jgi:14-3-3 protein epsilon
VKLGLALNFSVFYFEIMGDANKACEIARAALKAANSQFKDCPEDIFQEAQSIMELLKDNLNVWQESEER